VADPSQFWFVPGYYGTAYDPDRNRDTLVAGAVNTTLDGGAGSDSLVGSGPGDDDDKATRRGDMFIVSQGAGGALTISTHDVRLGDAVVGNGGNDTVSFTDSDYLWWGGHKEGDVLLMNGYTIASDISNLVLQMGAPTARNATGNRSSIGNDHNGWFEEIGSNRVVGNEFDNILNGGGVGGDNNVGGFDTLTGNGGSDLFVVRGYTDAQNTRWDPSYDRGVWVPNDSTYTDADFVLIRDFTSQDIIDVGNTNDFVIGRAPGYVGENNLWLPTTPPSPNNFGVFRLSNGSGNPDLVAHVMTADGLTLDTANLVNPIDPRGDGSRGIFYAINSVQFLDNGTPIPGADLFNPGNYVQTASTASLSDLMTKIV